MYFRLLVEKHTKCTHFMHTNVSIHSKVTNCLRPCTQVQLDPSWRPITSASTSHQMLGTHGERYACTRNKWVCVGPEVWATIKGFSLSFALTQQSICLKRNWIDEADECCRARIRILADLTAKHCVYRLCFYALYSPRLIHRLLWKSSVFTPRPHNWWIL